MLKKVITYIGIFLLCALFACYFYFTTILDRKGKEKLTCNKIEVTILDSMINRFINEKDVEEILTSGEQNPLKKNLYSLKLNELEDLLEKRSAIHHSDVSFDRNGTLYVDVTQRKPILRMETANGGFYADEYGYVFPLVSSFTSFVPIVTGEIPIDIPKDFRGTMTGKNKIFTDKIIQLVKYINNHEFWDAQIEQIDVLKNGDITFYTRIGDQMIYFGPIEDIDYKFAKLMLFYKDIVPNYGWDRYSTVNLKYSNQIVCTKRGKNKKII